MQTWQGVSRIGISAFLQADFVWRGVLDPGKMVSVGGVQEGLSTGPLMAVLLVLYPKPHNSIFPCMTPNHSEPSPVQLEPRGSDCT